MNRKGKLTLLIVFWSILLLCTGCSTDRNTNKTSEQDQSDSVQTENSETGENNTGQPADTGTAAAEDDADSSSAHSSDPTTQTTYTIDSENDLLDYISGRYQNAAGDTVYFQSVLKQSDQTHYQFKSADQDHPCNGTGWYEVTAVTADSVTIEMHGTTGGAPPQEITTIHVGDLNTGSIIYDGEEYFFIDNTPLHF
ncbi:MAG: hypothetical protein ACOYB8_08710 [Eubacteriaceae bacterium]|jgi:hypothetical protein